jgi:N-acetylmuramoyl-L-alanine amidase
LTSFLRTGVAILAAAVLIGAQQPVRIVDVRVHDAGDSVTMRLRADRTIASFQRPEVVGRTVTIRIPDVVHDADLVIPDGLSCAHETIRNILLYRLTVPWDPQTASMRRDGPRDLLVSIHKGAADPPPAADPKRKQWDLDVIVIDAGHGGVDAGAEGVNGVYEKNVTLAIAKHLRDEITAHMPGTKVVMTRDDDRFIELYRRGQIANDAGGKLFISIHCNSMPTKPHPAHGCETYILRPGRNADAARVAARENASIRFERSQDRYKGLDNDQLIVATMAQRSFVRLSEELAGCVQREVSRSTPLRDRGVSQAGFFVLVGSSMPNILFETAFLSNTDDAAYISSERGQTAVAQSMLRAIQRYARTYRSLLSK